MSKKRSFCQPFYQCGKITHGRHCGWQGTELAYDENGQGRCPCCNATFQGCLSEKEYDRRLKERAKQICL